MPLTQEATEWIFPESHLHDNRHDVFPWKSIKNCGRYEMPAIHTWAHRLPTVFSVLCSLPHLFKSNWIACKLISLRSVPDRATPTKWQLLNVQIVHKSKTISIAVTHSLVIHTNYDERKKNERSWSRNPRTEWTHNRNDQKDLITKHPKKNGQFESPKT